QVQPSHVRTREPDQSEDHAWISKIVSNKENKPNPKGVIVLGVYMHCQGCADKIVKYLRGFDGVEQIETDMKNHIVIVKGKKADPKKILERLPKKSNKHVKLISPILRVQPKEVEVVLKIYMHSEGC
ncbi:Heavy metal-associated isoprenylated plant protein 8, partial [Camellia lanceoleosa]